MNKYLLISLLLSFYLRNSIATQQIQKSQPICQELSNLDHKCKILGKTLIISYYQCPSFDLSVSEKKLDLYCSPSNNITNHYTYKLYSDKYMLDSYDTLILFPNGKLEEQYTIKTNQLISKELFSDIKNDNLVQFGIINKENSCIFTKTLKECKFHLKKGSKILILETLDKKWYKVYYKDKKELGITKQSDITLKSIDY